MASGVVGGGTASAVHYVRSKIREAVHDVSGDLEDVNSGYSWLESGGVLALTGASVFFPVLGVAAIALVVVGSVWAVRRARRSVDAAVDAEVRRGGPPASGAGT